MRSLVKISFVLIILLISIAVSADDDTEPAAKPTLDAHVGLGPYLQSQPYANADPIVVPSPVIFFDNRLFYVRWTRFGMYFYGKQNWGLSLTVQPRPWGYQAEDSPQLAGMAERQSAWEGGIALGGRNRLGFAELTYFHDLEDKSNGALLRVEAGKTITGGRWFHVPSIYIIRYNQPMIDYYYGVRQTESTAQRPAYTPGAAVNAALQHFLMYEMNRYWYLCANARIDYLAPEIRHSPLVDDQWMVSAMVSVLYKFTF